MSQDSVATSALVIVYPAFAMTDAMAPFIAQFSGSVIVTVEDPDALRQKPSAAVQRVLAQQKRRGCRMLTVASQMFGNRRGLALPVDLAVEIVRQADLQREQDRIYVTGAYCGWLPGSIDILAEAFTAMRFPVTVDPAPPRR